MSIRAAFIRHLARLLREAGYEIRRVGTPRQQKSEAYRAMHEKLSAEVSARNAVA